RRPRGGVAPCRPRRALERSARDDEHDQQRAGAERRRRASPALGVRHQRNEQRQRGTDGARVPAARAEQRRRVGHDGEVCPQQQRRDGDRDAERDRMPSGRRARRLNDREQRRDGDGEHERRRGGCARRHGGAHRDHDRGARPHRERAQQDHRMRRESATTRVAARGPAHATYHQSSVMPATRTLAGEPGSAVASGGTTRSNTSTTTATRRARSAMSTGDYRTAPHPNRYAEPWYLNVTLSTGAIARMTEPVRRVLVIVAHPDDCEFGAGGTVAKFVKEGKEVALVVATNGDKGSSDPSMTSPRLAAIRA